MKRGRRPYADCVRVGWARGLSKCGFWPCGSWLGAYSLRVSGPTWALLAPRAHGACPRGPCPGPRSTPAQATEIIPSSFWRPEGRDQGGNRVAVSRGLAPCLQMATSSLSPGLWACAPHPSGSRPHPCDPHLTLINSWEAPSPNSPAGSQGLPI